MKEVFFTQAIAEGIAEEMERDRSVFMIGEDIATYGGAFGASQGLFERFGPSRIIDSPISENSLVGLAIGAALTGLRPIVEIMYMDFITLAFDQILNKAIKCRYLSQGSRSVPLVIRTSAGGGRCYGPDHSQSLEGLFIHLPGLQIVAPSNPYDAKGMLKAAIRSNDPVLFIEYRMLYAMRGSVSTNIEEIVPLGKAVIRKEGQDITVVTFGRQVEISLNAINQIEKEISIELIDLRSLSPLDMDTILSSVKKTGHLVVVEEGCVTGGVCGEISAKVMEAGFYDLDAPIVRVGARDVPVPFSPYLENQVLPSSNSIKQAILHCIEN